LAKRSASAQIAVLSASQGDQESYEVPQNAAGTAPKHGAFTYALIEALSGKAAQGGAVTLQSAFKYVGPRVSELLRSVPRKAAQGPLQTPTLTANPALAGVSLVAP
jgi:uncharacterized caspase-like protein